MKKIPSMKQSKLLFFILLPLLLAAAGCNDGESDDLPDVPVDLGGMTEQEIQAVLVGKWEEIDHGNDDYPEFGYPGDSMLEFSSDSTGLGEGTAGPLALTNDNNRYNYRIDSACIYFTYDGREDYSVYRYAFLSSNKLRLDYVQGPISLQSPAILFYTYKRIK
jgi:hypothetical protein